MRQRYFCTFYDAIRTVLPAAVWYRYQELWHLRGQYRLSGVVRERGGGLPASSGRPKELSVLREAYGEGVVTTLRGLEKRGVVSHQTVGRRNVQDKTVQLVRLAIPPEDAAAWAQTGKIRAPYVRCGAVPVTARRDRRT